MIHEVLKYCSDKEKAFQNWMDRDCLLAREVERCYREIEEGLTRFCLLYILYRVGSETLK